jgi:hypothetical protein
MAAGDISDLMLARARTFLDEAVAAFYTDDEIFLSMSDGQNELITQLMNIWKQKQFVNFEEPLPEVLAPVVVSATCSRASANTYTLPSDYLQQIAVAAPGGEPILVRRQGMGKVAQKANTYLKAATGSDYCAVGSSIVSEGTDHASVTLTYVKSPANMTTSVDPALTSNSAKLAIVQYAFADLLKKDMRLQEAMQEFQKFLSMVLSMYV